MKFTILATALALASTALSAPGGCVTKSDAQTLVNRYIGIQNHQGSDLGTAEETAQQLLVKNYQEISDSILSLEQQPVSSELERWKRNAILICLLARRCDLPRP
jgi:hypothetical protein